MDGIRKPFLNPWMEDGDPMGYAGLQGQGIAVKAKRPAGWTPELEARFIEWMNSRAAESGTNANADTPLHSYDYRGLFNSGQGLALDPSDGLLHGSSQFKATDHPNRFVMDDGQLIDSRSGKKKSALEVMLELYLR